MNSVDTRKVNNVLNLLKGLACVGVVFIHVNFPGVVGVIVERLSRFAVPVFFMISGFYSFKRDEFTIKKRLYKILKIFLFGSVLYFFQIFFSNFSRGVHNEFLIDFFSVKTLLNAVIFCDFLAPVLWYLIAMAEFYVVWLYIVKHKKESEALYAIPFLFFLAIVLNTICDSLKISWIYHTNFITEAAPYFLFGLFIHKNKRNIEKIPFPPILSLCLLGGGGSSSAETLRNNC